MTTPTSFPLPVSPTAQAIVDHFNAAEQLRGSPYKREFIDPFTKRPSENGVTIPVRLLQDLRDECSEKASGPDLYAFVSQQRAAFEAWAHRQGLSIELTPTSGERFKQTQGGIPLATYLHDATEGAWRAWAHVAVQALQGKVPTQDGDDLVIRTGKAPETAAPLDRPFVDVNDGWTSGYGFPSASKYDGNPTAGFTSGA